MQLIKNKKSKMATQQELLNIIKQLRDYIANSNIPAEDSDYLYHKHLDLADSVLPESDDEEEDICCEDCERPDCIQCGECGGCIGTWNRPCTCVEEEITITDEDMDKMFCKKCGELHYQYDMCVSKEMWLKWCSKEHIPPCKCEN